MSHTATPRREQLYQALEAFSRSPRFFLFKGVQVGRLMPEGCGALGALGELTFEQLLDQVLSSSDSDPSTTAEQEDGLFHLLQVLSEDAGDSAQLAADDDISIFAPDSFDAVDIPTLDEDLKGEARAREQDEPDDVPIGSVPLELALRSNLSKIASHERYQSVHKRTLGEFWDSAWAEAPFEEAMSIEQFVGLDLAVLFKKRMVTDTRIQSILRALRRVIEVLDSGAVKVPSPRHESLRTSVRDADRLPKQLRADDQSLVDDVRMLHPIPLSVAALAVWEVLEQASIKEPLAQALCERCTPAECAAIVLGDALSGATKRTVKSVVNATVAKRSLELVAALLRATAVRLDHIVIALCGADAPPTTLSIIEAAVVARTLGAVPASVDGAVCEGFWTLYPEALQALVQRGQGKRSRSKSRVVGPETYAQLDPFLQRWLQAHGKGQGSRRESRNRLKHRCRKGK